MRYLTRGTGLSNTDGFTLSVWFYAFPQPITGTSVTQRNLFRCGDDFGGTPGVDWGGMTVVATVSDFGDLVSIDVRNCPEAGAQLATGANTTGGGPMSRGAWNHIVVNFQRLGLNSISAQMCLNGVIRSLVTNNAIADLTAIPLNSGFIGVPWDSGFALAPSLSPVLPLAQYQMWLYQNIAMTDANMANFFTIVGSIGTPKNYLVAQNAFGTPEICFVGNPTQFKINRGTLGDSFIKIGAINDFTPGPNFV